MEDREIPDPALEDEIRGVSREWTEEAAEDERLTELQRRRRLDLEAMATELVHRGDRVRAEMGSQTFSGSVIFAGSDYATIDRVDDTVDVRLDAAVWAVEPSPSGGHEQTGGSQTMKARLAEMASTSEQVRLIAADGRAILGSISVVAEDHIEVAQDGVRMVVPLRLVVALVRPKGPVSV